MTKEIDRIPIIHNKTLYTIPIINPKDIPSLPTAKCQRCGHTWTLRKPNPKNCPKCNSPYWNKPRRKKQ